MNPSENKIKSGQDVIEDFFARSIMFQMPMKIQ